MRFRTLLIHRCTLLTQGTIIGQDDYGRDIIGSGEIPDVPCRFDRIRQRAAADETGTDFIYDNILYFDKEFSITLESKIQDIKDKEGNPILLGSFSVLDILPIYDRSKLHHYEVTVQRM